MYWKSFLLRNHILAIMLSFMLVQGCSYQSELKKGETSSGDPSSPIVDFTLAPTAATIAASGTLQFLTVGGTSPYSYSITSGGGSISSSGLFTAPSSSDTVVIKVTDSAGQSLESTLTIVTAGSAIPPVVKIITPAASAKFQSTATVMGTCKGGTSVTVSGAGVVAPTPTSMNCSSGVFTINATFSNGDGNKVVQVAQTDADGSSSDSRTFVSDLTPPTSNSIAINSNDTYTQSLAATLTLASTDAVQMKILDSADCSGSGNWEEYSSSKSWALKNANAPNNVSVLYKDDVGNISACVTDSIVHDNQAPALTITSPTDGSYVQPSLTVTGGCDTGVTVNVAGSGLTAPTTASCTASNYSASVTLSAGEGSKQIQVSQTDAAGNSKTVTLNVVVDTLPPLANAITIDGGNSYATSTTVSLGLTSIGASEMLITNNSDCATGGTWEAYALTKSWTLPTLNAVNTVYAKFKDVAGNVSSCVNASITHDNTPPSVPTLSINGGASETKDTSVTLALSATGAGQMKIFDTVDCTGSGIWESYGTTKSWVLKNTNALNSLSVLFKDGAGNTSTCASATITHDNTVPTLTIVNPTANTTVASTNVTVSGTCETGLSVDISGAGLAAGTTGTCSGVFSESLSLTAGDGVKIIQVGQTDSVGNTTTKTVAIILSSGAPIVNSIAINGSASVTNSTAVTLSLTSPDATDMLITDNSDCSTGGAYEAFANSKAWTLPNPNALNTVYVKFKDSGGTESTCINAAILHDDQPPTGNVLAINGGATVTNSLAVSLNISSTGASQMLLTDNADCVTGGSWENFVSTKAWTLSNSNVNNTIYAKFKDAAGNVSACVSGSISHDDQDPTAPSLSINSGASYTNSLIASLDLSATGADQMKITNSADCSGAGIWEPYQASKLWVLPSANSNNDLSAIFKDAAGNISTCVAGSIAHDNIAPGLGVTTPTLNQLVTNTVTVSGACENGLPIAMSGGGLLSSATATCSSGGYSQAVSLSAGDGTKTFTVMQTDLASNQTAVTVTIISDVTAPSGNSMAINDGAAATNSTNVNLTLASTGASEMLITNSADCTTGGTWEAYAVNKAWTLGQTNAVATVYAKFRDTAGNVSSCVNDTIVHDDQPPALAYVSPADGSAGTGKITITGTCENGLSVALSGSGLLGPASTSCNGTFSQEVTFTTGAGAKPITIAQTDGFGNTTTVTRTFQNVITGPTNTSLAINGGVAVTNSTSVTLTLAATDAAEMYITNLNSCGGTPNWEAYGTSKAWTLAQTNATATVYAKFRDAGQVESPCISATIVHDNVAPSLAFVSPLAGANVGSTATLTGTCENGLTVSVSGADLNAPATTSCDGTFSVLVTFSAGNGNKTVQVAQTDAAGNSGSTSRTFNSVNTPPTGLSLAINGGAGYTNSTAVTLTPGASGASEMYITNTSGCGSGGVWEPYATTRVWSIAQTNATATVYAKYRDALGNETACVSSTIVHDNIPPAIAFTAPAANTVADTSLVIQGSCVAGVTVNISGAGVTSATTTPCAAGTFSQSVNFSAGDGSKVFVVSQTDPAGNVGLDSRVFTRSSSAPTGNSVIIAGGVGYTNTTAVTLTLASNGGTEMYITNTSGCGSGGTWEPMAPTRAWSLAQTNGTATVYAKFRDSLGNTSSCVSGTIVHDNVAPVVAVTSPAANTADQNGLTVSGTCETGSSVQIWGSGVSSPAVSACTAGTYSGAIVFSGTWGTKTVTVTQADPAGNVGTANISYVKALPGVTSSVFSNIIASANEAPSDGVAETTLFVSVKDSYGNVVNTNNVVEVTVSSSNVTLATGGACRTVATTCMKAVSAGNGVWTLTAKTSVAGSYSFTAVIAGSPDMTLTSTSVNFNDANFTILTAGTTITNATHGNKNLYFKTTGQSTFDATTVGQTFKNIFIGTGTSITHAASTSGAMNRLNINVSSINIMGTGLITADDKGLPAGYTYGASGVPSTAVGMKATNSAGASHGGMGAYIGGGAVTDPGPVYDDYRNPNFPGAGGIVAIGGGVIRIVASNACVLNTSGAGISANATAAGGGAGGSIYLKCNQFGGSAAVGAITAKGANSTATYGGSGGGRIALVSDNKIGAFAGAFAFPTDSTSLTAFKARVLAWGGRYTSDSRPEGGAGTVYLQNADRPNGTLIVDNGYTSGTYGSNTGNVGYTHMLSLAGTVSSAPGASSLPITVTSWPAPNANTNDMFAGLRIRPDVAFTNGTATNWSDDNIQVVSANTATALTTVSSFSGVSSGATFRSIDVLDGFDVGGGALFKSYGDLYVAGSWVGSGSLSYSPPADSIADFVGSASTNLNYQDVTFNNLTVTLSRDLSVQNLILNNARANVRADNTNIVGNLTATAGTLVTTNLTILGNANFAGGTVKQPSTTAGQEYRLNMSVAGSLNLTSGTISAAGTGYLAGYSYGSAGPATTLTSLTNGGGSHGGLGAYGGGAATDVGPTYDDYRDPNYSGAGGATGGGAGGGVVKISVAGNCAFNGGKITADGNAGGGAGGSVKITCSSYNGTPVVDSITAKGGASSSPKNSGGGGRIAIYSTGNESSFLGGMSWPSSSTQMTSFKTYVKAWGGTYASAALPEGGAGSVYLKHSGINYGAMIIDNGSPTGTHSSSGVTFLLSIAGTVNAVPAGNNLPVSVSTTPALAAGYTNLYKGLKVRPNLAFTNGTSSDWTDDNVLTVDTNTTTSLTMTSAVGSVNNGSNFRSIDIFDTLEVSGNARIKTNGDIYVLNGAVSSPGSMSSIVKSGSYIDYNSVGSDNGIDYTFTTPTGTIVLGNVVVPAMSVSATTTLTVNGNITTSILSNSGVLSVTGCINTTSHLNQINNSITTDCINVGGDLNITGGSIAHYATDTTTLHRLIGTISGNLNMSGSGAINLMGKGYLGGVGVGYSWGTPDGRPSTALGSGAGGASHAGPGAAASGVAYDDYKNPQYPGAGGSAAAYVGGGAVRLTVSGLCSINGSATINADGNTTYLGAGGTVYLNCNGFTGNAGASAIVARGTGSGTSGGMIALISTGNQNSFSGSFAWPDSNSGISNIVNVVRANGGTLTGGSGTIYLKHSGQQYGSLILDNKQTSLGGSTFARSISGTVTSVAGTTLTLNVTSTPALGANYAGSFYAGMMLRPDITYTNGTAADLTDDNVLTVTANSSTGVTVASVGVGVTTTKTFRTIDILDNLEILGGAVLKSNGDVYVLNGTLSNSGGANMNFNQGLVDVLGTFNYPFGDLTLGGTVTLASNINSRSLNVTSGTITGTNFTTAQGVTVSGGILNAANVTSGTTLTVSSGSLNATGCVTVNSSATISGGTLKTDCLNVTNDLAMSGGTLTHYATDTTTLHRLNATVGGQMSLSGNASITADGLGYPATASSAAYSWGTPDGRPSTAFGPTTTNGGSHAGLGLGGTVTYDDYRNPQFPGGGAFSGATTYQGGGVLRFTVAGECSMSGTSTITADGAGNAAGGSIYLNCGGFNGSPAADAVSAYALSGTAGGGGMITLISTGDQSTFKGGFAWPTNAAGLSSLLTYVNAQGGTSGGAGTIYLKNSGQTYGSLILNNEKTSIRSPTQLRGLAGTIASVAGTTLTLNVSTTPALGANYAGYYEGVRLRPDTSFDNGTSNNWIDDNVLTVSSNSATGVTVASTGTGVTAGKSYRTIDVLDTLDVLGGSVLKSNGDVYVLSGSLADFGGPDLDFNQGLTDLAGSLNYPVGDITVGGTYTSTADLIAKSVSLSSGILSFANITTNQAISVNTAALNVTSLNAGTSVQLAGGTLSATGCVNTGTYLSITGGTLKTDCLNLTTDLLMTGGTLTHFPTDTTTLHRLIGTVGGKMNLSGSALIDVSKLGYPAGTTYTYYSWGAPDGRPSTALKGPAVNTHSGGSHAGLGVNGGPTYDDFKNPQYPGSGAGAPGATNVATSGGGVVRLTVNSTCTIASGASINASGNVASGTYTAVGAGGTIYLKCAGFGGDAGANAIDASALQGSNYKGGGGMIALISTGDQSSFTGSFAWPSSSSALTSFLNVIGADGSLEGGGAGTIYIKHSGQQYGSLIVDNKKTIMSLETQIRGFSGTLGSVSGTTIGLNVASTPALDVNYVNYYQGLKLRPDLSYINGTANDWTDDNVLTVSSNTATDMTVASVGSGVTSGTSFRSIEILDNLEILGGGLLKSNGDIYVLSGNLTRSGAADINFDTGFFTLGGAFNYPLGDINIAMNGILNLPASVMAKTFNVSWGTAKGANLTTTGSITVLTGSALDFVNITSGTTLKVASNGANGLNATGCVAVGTNMLIYGGTVQTDCLNITNDLTFTAGTIKHYPTTATDLHRFIATIGGSLTMNGTARINVDTLGYLGVATSSTAYSWGAPDGRPSTALATVTTINGGSHGGMGYAGGPTYDDYKNPQYPGAGSASPGVTKAGSNGGGVVRMTVSGVCSLNDTASITAAGGFDLGTYSAAGAGGSIYLKCGGFTGDAGANAIAANANQTSLGAGGGGMVALISTGDQSSFTGSFAWPTNSTSVANLFGLIRVDGGPSYGNGAGTIYIKHSGQQYGSLLVDNRKGSVNTAYPTTLRGMSGTISSVSGTTLGLNVTSSPALGANYAGYYAGAFIRPDISYTNGTASNWSDDNVLAISTNSASDITVASTGSGVSNGTTFRTIDILDNLEIQGGGYLKTNGDIYVLNGSLSNPGVSNIDFNQGLVDAGGSYNFGLGDVTLSASSTLPSNLSLKSLTVTGGAVTATNLTTTTGGLSVTGGTLTAANITTATSIGVSGGTLNVTGCANAGTSLEISSGTMVTDCFATGADLKMTAGTLKHYPTTTTTLHRLVGTIGGNVNLSGTAIINVDELGYPGVVNTAAYTWGAPDGRPSSTLGATGSMGKGGSHGGVGVGGGPVYDDYRNPQFPGSGAYFGTTYSANGGGVVRLTAAGSCILNSGAKISAMGGIAGTSTSYTGGAGGSIYLNCGSFGGTAGANAIIADASQNAYSNAAGGMIALISSGPKSSFAGSFAWPSDSAGVASLLNVISNVGSTNGGAGTIFIKHSGQQYGSLLVDNGTTTLSGSTTKVTQLRGFSGSITSVTGNTVGVSVSSTPALGADYVGYYAGVRFRPDLSYTNGTANNWTDDNVLTVTNNTTADVTVASTGSGVSNGTSFRSIDILDTLDLTGGALLKSNGDIYVLSGNLSDSGGPGVSFTNGMYEILGQFNYPFADVSLAGSYTLPTSFAVRNLTISSGVITGTNVTTTGTLNLAASLTATTVNVGTSVVSTAGTLTATTLSTGGSVNISGGTVSTQNLTVGGDLNISSGNLTHPTSTSGALYKLVGTVAGSLNLTGTGSIDVSVKGYPATYSYADAGPSTTLATAQGTHAGYNTSGTGAIYGSVRDPDTAGGGGASGAGGGVVKLTVNSNCTLLGSGVNITANGGTSGAGGSVNLRCGGFAASGLAANAISSSAGSTNASGGRIALISTGGVGSFGGDFAFPVDSATLATFKSKVKAKGANSGGAGTVYLKHSGQNYGTLIVDNGGTTMVQPTLLPSLAGTVNGAPSGTNLPVTVTSTPALNANYTNAYKGMMLRPTIGFTNGTTNDWTDDNVLTITGNSGTSLTASSTITGVNNGDSFRTIDIFDSIDVGGGANLVSNGDIYILNGSISDPGNPLKFTDGWISLNATGAAMNTTFGDVSFTSIANISSPISGASVTINGGNYSGPSITSTNGPINLTGLSWTTGTSMSATGGGITLNGTTITLNGTASTTGNFVIPAGGGTNTITTVTATGSFSNAGTGTNTFNNVTAGGSFTLSGAGSQISNNIQAGGNIILSAGSLYHPDGTTTQLNRLNIVSTNGAFVMTGAASISLSNRGYIGGYSYGNNGTPSTANIAGSSRAGSHAGTGGGAGTAGMTYDNPKDPVYPGAGRTAGGGGQGGGAVKVVASNGVCQFDGTSTIFADGASNSGAAGGSINLRCKAFAGNSTGSSGVVLRANGAAGTSLFGGGSGGMIALVSSSGVSSFGGIFAYPTDSATMTTFLGRVKANGGAYFGGTNPEGGAGTIYLKHSGNGNGDLIIAHDNGANNGTGTAANIGYTQFPTASDNSNTVTSAPDANTLAISGANYSNKLNLFAGLNLHIFDLAASKNPLDGTHITTTLTSNDATQLYASGNPFPVINNDKYYRFVYRFNKVDISGKAKVDLGASDLVTDACDIHSAAATTFDVPTGSSLKANVLSMPTCSTKTGTITNVNGSF